MTKRTFKWWMFPLVPLGILWFIMIIILLYPVLIPTAWTVLLFCGMYDIDPPNWALDIME